MDVAAFLRGLSLDAYVGEVERHAIDGDMLADLIFMVAHTEGPLRTLVRTYGHAYSTALAVAL